MTSQRAYLCRDRDRAVRPRLPTCAVRVARAILIVAANRPNPVLRLSWNFFSSLDIITPNVISSQATRGVVYASDCCAQHFRRDSPGPARAGEAARTEH